ncbi:hypothetical protein [Paraburkholderia youngii]|uniref:hypothetical protein n=1 Tax=Paraburkholderia youngii TaxID=2782701 RepID=UPI003D1FB736
MDEASTKKKHRHVMESERFALKSKQHILIGSVANGNGINCPRRGRNRQIAGTSDDASIYQEENLF